MKDLKGPYEKALYTARY